MMTTKPKLYSSRQLPTHWIGDDVDGSLVMWPARAGGWSQRVAYKGTRRSLIDAAAQLAYGTGWPGAVGKGRPSRAGASADERVTVRLTPDERKRWERAAGDQSLGEWIRSVCNKIATEES